MNMNDAIIEVLRNIAGYVWNVYTEQKEYCSSGKTFEYKTHEVMEHCYHTKCNFYGRLRIDTKGKQERTWLWNDEKRVLRWLTINISDEWKMEFQIYEVFNLLDRMCKFDGRKLDMRFCPNKIAPTAITVDADAPDDTRKWRLNGTLLTELDMGTINHKDIPLATSYSVYDGTGKNKGKRWTVDRPWNSPDYVFRPRRPKDIKYDGGWWMMLVA